MFCFRKNAIFFGRYCWNQTDSRSLNSALSYLFPYLIGGVSAITVFDQEIEKNDGKDANIDSKKNFTSY